MKKNKDLEQTQELVLLDYVEYCDGYERYIPNSKKLKISTKNILPFSIIFLSIIAIIICIVIVITTFSSNNTSKTENTGTIKTYQTLAKSNPSESTYASNDKTSSTITYKKESNDSQSAQSAQDTQATQSTSDDDLYLNNNTSSNSQVDSNEDNYNYTEDSSIVEDKPTEENETSNIDSAKPTEQNSKQEEKYLSISDISVSRLNDNVLIASIIGVFQNFSSQEILNKISISSTSGTPTIYEDVNLNNNSFLFKIDITDCDGDLNISINDYYFYQDISSIV